MNPLLVLLGEVTVVFGAALLGAWLASRARAALRHLILACAFLVVLVLPLAALVSPTIAVEIAALPAVAPEPITTDLLVPPIIEPTEVAPVSVDAMPVVGIPSPPAPSRPIPATTWLLLAWAVITVAALIPVVSGLLHFRRIRRSSHLWHEGAERVAALIHPAALPNLKVLLNVKIAAPITGGLIRPAIALPVDAMNWSDAHLANALLHELEHVRRCDWAVHLAARVACALYWFHPLSWIAWRNLRLEAERACDDAVLALEDGTVYAEQLLQLARRLSGQPVPPGIQMAGDSNLTSRIKAALDGTRPRGRTGKVAVAIFALGAILTIALLAPLRPIGPARPTVVPVVSNPAPSTPSLEEAPPLSTKPSVTAFSYARSIGLADLRDGGCLSIFNSSIEPGTKVTLLVSRANDPSSVIEATVEAAQTRECRSSLDRNDSANMTPTYYRVAMPSGSTQYGIAFAILDPQGTIALRNGRIAADIDGDGSPESFETCNSTENVHYMVWSGLATQRRQRWHGNIYSGYDMEPTCTDAVMPAASVPYVAPGSAGSTTQDIAANILDIVNAAQASDAAIPIIQFDYLIRTLVTVQRKSQAILDRDSQDPAVLAMKYVALLNALGNAANGATGAASRANGQRSSTARLEKLAADLRSQSSKFSDVAFPILEGAERNSPAPAQGLARTVRDTAEKSLADTAFVGPRLHNWLAIELTTLDRVARSVMTDEGMNPLQSSIKLNAMLISLDSSMRNAFDIADRTNESGETREKAKSLAVSLRKLAQPVAPPQPPASADEINTVFLRIRSRINQLELARVRQTGNDWEAFYKWRNPAAAPTEAIAVAVSVQFNDSAEAARQGLEMNILVTSVAPTRREDFRGTQLVVWERTTLVEGEPVTSGRRFLFRVGNDVINVSAIDAAVSKDLLMSVLEVVSDELKAARK